MRLRETAETLPGSRRGGPHGRPFVDGAARPGGRALQKEAVPERRRGQAPALQRRKHSKQENLFQGGRPHRAAPTEKTNRELSSAKPGAEDEPQRRQFLQTQGPVARNETIKATQILRAGNFLPDRRDNPRNGVRGKATMSTKCSSGAVPGGVLVTLPPRAKSLAARRRRNLLRICYKIQGGDHPRTNLKFSSTARAA